MGQLITNIICNIKYTPFDSWIVEVVLGFNRTHYEIYLN